MNTYITQFKVLFWLSWVVLYLVFPAWRNPGRDFPFADNFAITTLMAYFTVSAYLLNRYFSRLTVDSPVIIKNIDWSEYFRNNVWLVLVCSLSVILHIHTFSFLTNLGELPFLRQTFWMYDFMNGHWHQLFDFPIQYFFWAVIILFALLIKQKKKINFMQDQTKARFSVYRTNNLTKSIYVFIIFVFFNLYAYFFPYYSWNEAMQLLRYPPVSRYLYLITYSAFGISDTGPRTVQLIFYILGAVYLYRTIYLFREKETALLGATIYLFSPIIFSYASQAALTSGTVFFIILISYYFLAFIKGQDSRDLLLTAYFIGVGVLYKRVVLLMFIICVAYLLLSIVRKREGASILHLKILMLSLIPVLPWLMIGPGMYKAIWSNLITFNELSVYSLMIQGQISWIVFFLFLCSSVYSLFAKKDDLSFFFGLLFIAYYIFFTLMEVGEYNHRYALALYPAIAVFLAQFVYSIARKVRWKHTFKFVSSVLSVYLIIICMVPRSGSSLVTYKYKDHESQYFPVDKATDWFKDNVREKDKVLFFFLPFYKLYVDRMYADKSEIDHIKFVSLTIGNDPGKIIYPLKNLREFCNVKKISYVMFPFSPNNALPPNKSNMERQEMTEYLKEKMDSEFAEAAKFNLEDNYLIIYKLKE